MNIALYNLLNIMMEGPSFAPLMFRLFLDLEEVAFET